MLLCAAVLAVPAAQGKVPARSSVYDHAAAARARAQADYSGTVVVVGVDDTRRAPRPQPLEQRFAAALTRARPAADPARLSAVVPGEVPCFALPSQQVPVGGSYNPHGFCP